MSIDCSIIMCTRNRASMLRQTLEAFRAVTVPPDVRVEMIIADNGSTDDTAEVIRNARLDGISIRGVYEPKPGKSRAQNAAMGLAEGEVLLFTDDDVEPAGNWIEEMARPLLENRCDAVAGRILLSDDLRRSWFTGIHLLWLAEVGEPAAVNPELVGASMGIKKSVFEKIDNFDENIGPGASGFGEETLLWWQMIEAGFRIHPVNGTFVVHHPEASRLLRSSWLSAAAKQGRSSAYLLHHWKHAEIPSPRRQAFWIQTKLFLRRLRNCFGKVDAEGCSEWEMVYVVKIERLKQFAIESRGPRNYEQRALRRNAGFENRLAQS